MLAVDSYVDFTGVSFGDVQSGFPAEVAGVLPDVTYNSLNDIVFLNTEDFLEVMKEFSPGDTVVLANENLSHSIVLASHPDNSSKPYLGVLSVSSSYVFRPDASMFVVYSKLIFAELLFWLFAISLGLGLANLLPIGPVDGGRMLFTALNGVAVKKEVLVRSFIKYVSLFILFIVLILLWPIFKATVLAILNFVLNLFF